MLSLFRRVLPRALVLPTTEVAIVPTAVAVERSGIRAFAPNLAAAALCTLVAVAFAGGFGQLVFGGALAPEMGRGIFAALLSTMVMLVVLPWRGAFAFSVGGPDSNPSAVLAVTLAGIAQSFAVATGPASAALLPTVSAYLLISTVGCGAIVWLLGARSGGRCVRYIPYPVVGGFLAGSGYLLVAGAFRALTGTPLSWQTLGGLGAVNPLAGLTTLVVAAVLVVGTRRVQHFLVIPGVIVGSVFAFHAVRMFLGIDLATARSDGLLLPLLESGVWQGVGSFAFGDVRWDVIASHLKDIAAMTAVVVVTALMNTTSLEVATGRDGDADRELRAIGIGNIVAGFLGGMVGSNSFNRTVLNLRAGATSRWAAWICAAVIAGVMVFAPGAMGLLPRPVLTGLILYLGVSLLIAWTVDARRSLSALDYAVVLMILAVVASLGIVSGVVLGIFIACVSFVVTMSRSRNVRQAFTAEKYRSNVERTAQELASLRTHGGALRGFVLDGVLFFGTATHLLDEIRRSLARTRIVLLDFRLVQGIDGSAIVVLKRVHAICRDAGAQLVFTGLKPRFENLLARGGFDFAAVHVRRFADLDRGVEWCEEEILGEFDGGAPSLTDMLGEVLGAEGAARLLGACERRRFVPGALLVRQGEPSDEMFFIERGRVHVLLPLASDGSAGSKRLWTYGGGTVVGEMGFYSAEPRSADIVAEEETETFCLTREKLAALETEYPSVGHALHRMVILTLSQRLRSANDEIRELL